MAALSQARGGPIVGATGSRLLSGESRVCARKGVDGLMIDMWPCCGPS